MRKAIVWFISQSHTTYPKVALANGVHYVTPSWCCVCLAEGGVSWSGYLKAIWNKSKACITYAKKITVRAVFTYLSDEIKKLQHFSSRTLVNTPHIHIGMLTAMFILSLSCLYLPCIQATCVLFGVTFSTCISSRSVWSDTFHRHGWGKSSQSVNNWGKMWS